LRPDNDANKDFYGKEINAEAIVLKHEVAAPPSARLLLATLDKKSPKRNPDSAQLECATRTEFCAADLA